MHDLHEAHGALHDELHCALHSQFPPSELFIMITDITAPTNILLRSIINIFPGG